MKTNGTAQPEIISKTIASAVRLLNATGAKYKVIAPDGTEYGDLVIQTEKPRVRVTTHERGYYNDHITPFLGGVKPGDVVTIPYKAGSTPIEMRSVATAKCHQLWGKGSYTSSVGKHGVEILRIS